MQQSRLPEPRGPAFQNELRWLRDFWSAVRRNWVVVPVVVAVCVLTALVVAEEQAPVYESQASLLFHREAGGAISLGQAGPLPTPGGSGIETEVAILSSRTLAETVVDSLALHVRLDEPAAPRATIFRDLRAPRSAATTDYTLVYDADGAYRLTGADGDVEASAGTVRIGEPARVGDLVFTLRPELAASPPPSIRLHVADFRAVTRSLRGALLIEPGVQKGQIVTITYRDVDSVLAARVPNTLAAAFIDYKQGTAASGSQATVQFLREQVARYEADLLAAENRLQAYREQNQIVSVTDEATQQVQRLATLRARRDEIQVEQEALQQLLTQAQAQNNAAGQGAISYRQVASFPALFTNRAVQDILSSLTTLENTRADMLIRRTEQNLDVQGLTSRIRDLEMELYKIASSHLRSLESQLAAIDANLAEFSEQLALVPEREIEFARLLRQQELIAQIYNLLQTQLKEAEIQNAAEPSEVSVLDPALIPIAPISSGSFSVLYLAGALGLVLAFGILGVGHALDSKIRTKEGALEAAGMPIMGVIPHIGAAGPAIVAGPNGATHRWRRFIPLTPPPAGGADLVVARAAPLSPAAEAFRSLRTSLSLAASRHDRFQVVMVTSPAAGDGKSVTSVNLALSYAQQGIRAILVDADLRRGAIARLLGVDGTRGLSQVLAGQPVDQHVLTVESGIEGLDLAVLGSGPRPNNPGETIAARRMTEVMEELRERYEVIILDAPPVNAVTDAMVLGQHVDASLLVTRVGVTDRGGLEQAAVQLAHLGVPVEGLVVNGVRRQESLYSGDLNGSSRRKVRLFGDRQAEPIA